MVFVLIYCILCGCSLSGTMDEPRARNAALPPLPPNPYMKSTTVMAIDSLQNPFSFLIWPKYIYEILHKYKNVNKQNFVYGKVLIFSDRKLEKKVYYEKNSVFEH